MLLQERIYKHVFSRDVLSQSIPGVPVAELAGDKRVLIENHKGVTEYGPERIGVKVAFGVIFVCGKELTLLSMSRNQLVVCGMIDTIQLDRRGDGGNGR